MDDGKQDLINIFAEEFVKKFGTEKVTKKNKKLYAKIKGKESLITYCEYIDDTFLSPSHIQLIAKHLEQIAEGKLKRLIINMPPRHGKSQLTTRLFPSWFIGKFPNKQLIICSNSFSMAEDFTGSIKDIVTNELYKVIFDELKLKEDTQSKGTWKTDKGGVIKAAGIGGQILGRGAHLAIIDDPVKDYEEAFSETIRENTFNWYRSTLRTRLEPNGAIIVIMQRWHSDDLTGKLLKQDGNVDDGGLWTVLNLPVLGEDGVPLWHERYPIDAINEIRKSQGEKIFQAQYMQKPVDIVERLFDEIKYREPNLKNIPLIAYLDPAFGGKDFSALTIGCNIAGEIFVVYGEVWKGEIDITYDRVCEILNKYQVSKLVLESNQAQGVLSYEFQKRKIFVKTVHNVTNKHFRICSNVKTAWSKVFFSRNVQTEYCQQILNYSESAKNDDAPDSLAGLITELEKGNIESLKNRYNF